MADIGCELRLRRGITGSGRRERVNMLGVMTYGAKKISSLFMLATEVVCSIGQ
jgi:hypothetical protein